MGSRLIACFGVFCFLVACERLSRKDTVTEPLKPWSFQGWDKEEISQALAEAWESGKGPPKEMNLRRTSLVRRLRVHHTLDLKLQAYAQDLFKKWQPDFGALVALDARSGSILALVSHQRQGGSQENWALKASFPAASVFKLVTATAAIEKHEYSPDSILSWDGRSHTLYRYQVYREQSNRWTRYMSLREAFGKSINPVFGKLGLFTLGAHGLREFAGRYGFNRKIASDIPMEDSRALIGSDPWSLVESASGFTQSTTMSPLHGALMAAAIVNQGVLMEPYVVESLTDLTNTHPVLYVGSPKEAGLVMRESTAQALKVLMRETVKKGTSRSAFRSFFRKPRFSHIDVGGKTGSLTGLDPKGKVDWFVGYSDDGLDRLAWAVLTVNEELWRVKSARLAKDCMEQAHTQLQIKRNAM